jgi:UDP-N-acetylmuramate: L-alanyl-gamma-D-glutamyl-meso-diaminopimelate ligase
VRVFDDFAHHPTAIRTTLDGLRRHTGEGRIIAVLEPRSNTMRMGVHKDELPSALAAADLVHVYAPANLGWDPRALFAGDRRCRVADRTDEIVQAIAREAVAGDQVLVMSNGGFEDIHRRILDALGAPAAPQRVD